MKELGYIFFGFLLALIPAWWARRRRLKSHLLALRAEANICRDQGRVYLKDDIRSPLYRLPLAAFQASFPALLGEAGFLIEEEVRQVSEFFSKVEDVNRGLDYVHHWRQVGDDIKEMKEAARVQLKVASLLELHPDLIEMIDRRRRISFRIGSFFA